MIRAGAISYARSSQLFVGMDLMMGVMGKMRPMARLGGVSFLFYGRESSADLSYRTSFRLGRLPRIG